MPDTSPPKPPQDNSETAHDHDEDLLDEAVEETFPASDPISPARTYKPAND